VCEGCLEEDRLSDAMVCNMQTCRWQCPACTGCQGYETCSQTSCACECSISLSCGPGFVWDEELCDCTCDTAQQCDEQHLLDVNACACVCRPDCGGTCTDGLYCQQSLCLCLPMGG
jgi:hypothetical protein